MTDTTSDSPTDATNDDAAAGSEADTNGTDMNERAEKNLESGEVDGRPPLEGAAEPDSSVTEQDDELGLRENELLPNGEALHDANQDVDPDDQHDDAAE
jgi:hypothetical protein